MGRVRFFRQKLIRHVDSVVVKPVYAWLLHQTRERFGVAAGEAEQVAQKGHLLLTRTLVRRAEEQILFPALAGREVHQKRHARELPRQEVVLTPWSHDDLEVHREFGLKALQNARLARLIEEAYWQDSSLSTNMLCFLTNITAKSIRERLIPLWEAGIRLPLAGMAKKYRQSQLFRAKAALERFLSGAKPGTIRQQFWLSLTTWQQYQVDFLHIAQLATSGLDTGAIGRRLGLHPHLVAELQDLQRRTGGAAQLAKSLPGRLVTAAPLPLASDDPGTLFLDELTRVSASQESLARSNRRASSRFCAVTKSLSRKQRFNQAMCAFEAQHGIERVKPGEWLVQYRGHLVTLPLLTPEWARQLAEDRSFGCLAPTPPGMRLEAVEEATHSAPGASLTRNARMGCLATCHES